MAISSITREQFQALALPDECRSTWRKEHETEWYLDDAQRVAGVLIMSPLSLRWLYAFCTRSPGGTFSLAATGKELRLPMQAKQELLATMARLATAGSEP